MGRLAVPIGCVGCCGSLLFDGFDIVDGSLCTARVRCRVRLAAGNGCGERYGSLTSRGCAELIGSLYTLGVVFVSARSDAQGALSGSARLTERLR